MRKMFTKLFGLTLLVYLASSFSVVQAQVDTDCLTLTMSDVVLVTDITTVCDSALIQYKVTGFPDSAEYSFNGVGDTTAASFTPDSTFYVKEGTGFVVQVRTSATCYSQILTVPGENLIDPVYVDTLLLTQPQCFDDEGELTVVVGGNQAFYVNVVDSATEWLGPNEDYPLYSGTQFQAAPGSKYYVRVEDAIGCAPGGWDSIMVDNAPAELVIADVNAVNNTASCVGDSVEVQVVGVDGGAGGTYWVTLGGMTDTVLVGNTVSFMVPAGIYTATAKDSAGCEVVSDSVAIIVNPAAIGFDISLDDIACTDSTDGAIYIHDLVGPSGSVWTGTLVGADTSMVGVAIAANDTIAFEGLAVGYYSVWVNNGTCDSVAYDNPNGTGNVISLQAPGEIELTVTVDTAVCMGDSSMIMASATGGSGSYEFSVDGGSTWGTAGTMDEWTVYFGTYNVVVRDAGTSSCEIPYAPITLTAPSAVVVGPVAVVSPTCPGGNDGVINITASGGAGTLWYSLDSMSWKENNIFAVFAGDYTVYVRTEDCENDVAQMDVTVVALDTNTINITLVDTVNECNGVNSNEFTVDLGPWANQSGEHRTARVYYSDDMNDIYVNNTDTLPFLGHPGVSFGGQMNFEAGTYYFWAIDSYGCIADNDLDGTGDYVMVTITEEGPLTVSGKVTGEASCYGNYDGEMTIVAGESYPTKYGHANTLQAAMQLDASAMTDWPTGADSVTIQVGKGTYYVVVTNDCGAKAYDGPFVVDGLEMVTIADTAMSVTDIVCYGDSVGVIEVFPAMGGTEDFTYTLQVMDGAWMDVTGYVDVTETLFENLPVGDYKVVVTDLGGCDGAETGTITVVGPSSPVQEEDRYSDDITCFGASDGAVGFAVNGGTAPYEYKIGTLDWLPFPDIAYAPSGVSNEVLITEPGTYTVRVRDSLGCELEDPFVFVINEPKEILVDIDTTNNTNTCTDPNGELAITVTGGRPGVQYYVQVNDSILPAMADSAIAVTYSDLGAGDYIVTVTETDTINCEVMAEATITSPDSLDYVAVIMDSVYCNGSDDGVIVVSGITGGDAPYMTTISGPVTGTKDSTATEITFSDLVAGLYTVTVTDAIGCTKVTPLTVGEPDELMLEATHIADITCVADGQFSVQATGGLGGYKYFAALSELPEHILLPNPDSSVWQSDGIFTVDVAGTYIVWAMDANECVIGGEENDMGNPVNEWRVQIEEPEIVVTVNAAVTDAPECNGDMTAMISVPADSVVITLNGVPMVDPVYSVMIDTVMTDTLADVGAGTYVVVVTHEDGCFGTDTVVIAEPEVLEVTIHVAEGQFSCPGVTEGFIQATVTGGTEFIGVSLKTKSASSAKNFNPNYQFQLWQDGVLKTDYVNYDDFLVTIGHDYVIVVMDMNGCTDTSDVLTINPVAPVEIVDIMDVTCSSDTLASVKVTAVAEGERMVYVKWTQFEAESGIYSDSTELMAQGEIVISQMFEFDNENVDDIHYEFQVIDEMGCMSLVDTITLDQVISSPLELTVTAGAVDGCGTDVTITAAGGVAPYVVMVDDMEVSEDMVVLGGGMHTIKVMDAHECMVMEDLELDYPLSADTALVTYTGEATQLVVEDLLDTMLYAGEYSFYYDVDTACVAELNVVVTEKDRMQPVLDTVTPMETIADNHPLFEIVFEDVVTFNDSVMGYLTVTPKDSADAVLVIAITEAMVDGNTITIDYVAAEGNSLDKNTTYVVAVDSGIVNGDGLAWDGEVGDWMFTTGPDFATDITPGFDAVEYKVYPNPFNDHIKIDNFDKLTRVVVSNIAGQRVLDIEYPSYEIRTDNLVTGVYVVNLIADDIIVKSERLIKR